MSGDPLTERQRTAINAALHDVYKVWREHRRSVDYVDLLRIMTMTAARVASYFKPKET